MHCPGRVFEAIFSDWGRSFDKVSKLDCMGSVECASISAIDRFSHHALKLFDCLSMMSCQPRMKPCLICYAMNMNPSGIIV